MVWRLCIDVCTVRLLNHFFSTKGKKYYGVIEFIIG